MHNLCLKTDSTRTTFEIGQKPSLVAPSRHTHVSSKPAGPPAATRTPADIISGGLKRDVGQFSVRAWLENRSGRRRL